MLIDDLSREDLLSDLRTSWRAVSDRVMGGVSRAELRFERHLGRPCLHLYGEVRLDNDGGFLQMALDLDPLGNAIDAREYRGLRLLVLGNGERYSAHLRTEDLVRPWQSYRARFNAPPEWHEVELPFSGFVPHRVEVPLDLTRLRRIGLVAIGRAFSADLRVARVEFYR